MKLLFSLVIVVVAAFFLAACNPLEYKSKSGLQVITNEVPSGVFLNGQYLNKTPLIEKNIKPGTYHVLIQPEDTEFVPYETDITLRKGLLTVLTWKPEKRPELSSGVLLEMEPLENTNTPEIQFTTIPDNAIITFNNKKEFSPITLTDITPGVHEFEITLPSYETQKHSINVQTGYKMMVTVKLAKLHTNEATEPSVVESASESATPSPSPVSTPSASPIIQPSLTPLGGVTSGTVKILKTNFFQNGTEVLRVRATPASSGAELGFAPVGSTYPYLGEQKNGWYKINFQGTPAWVNGGFSQVGE